MSFRSYFAPYGVHQQLINNSEKDTMRFSSVKFLKILLGFFGTIFCLGCILDVQMTNVIYYMNKKIENSLPVQQITQTNYFVRVNRTEESTIVNVHDSIERKNSEYTEIVRFNESINNILIEQSNISDEIVIKPCPAYPPGLVGPIEANVTKLSLNVVDNIDFGVDHGGYYTPRDCKPKDRVAIIIPYRDRAEHLGIFLNNMHTYLKKQQIEYQIFVVEQKGNGIFNRAILKNIGYVEANKLQDWDCYVFHDVDLLPLDDRILYTCPEQPRHLSAAIDKFNFILPYDTLCGGVLVMNKNQFKSVNGFSNSYWGWGAEDDDMTNRIAFNNFTITRYPMNISRYTMLSHVNDEPNPKRYDVLKKGKLEDHRDGLLNLNYTLAEIQIYNLYMLFLAELIMPS